MRYNNKLKREFSDGSLSSKKWWKLLTLYPESPPEQTYQYSKMIEHHAYTSAKVKAEKFCQTFCHQMHSAEESTPQVQHTPKNRILFRTKDVRKLLY